jgi:hypothetical protein
MGLLLPATPETVVWPTLGDWPLIERTTLFWDGDDEIAAVQLYQRFDVYIGGKLILDPEQQRAINLYKVDGLLAKLSFEACKQEGPEAAKASLLDLMSAW